MITIDKLKEIGAPEGYITAMERYYPNGMSPDIDVKKLPPLIMCYVNREWEKVGLPKRHEIYLRGADLRKADLRKAALSGRNLNRVDLSKATLFKADLSGAKLCRANFYKADLSRGDLSGARLYKANLARADLCGTNLYETDLQGADLGGADLFNANLTGANLCRTNLTGANLLMTDLLQFLYQKHSAVAHTSEAYSRISASKTIVNVGCESRTIEDWLKNYQRVGKERDYTEKQIKMYYDFFKLVAKNCGAL